MLDANNWVIGKPIRTDIFCELVNRPRKWVREVMIIVNFPRYKSGSVVDGHKEPIILE